MDVEAELADLWEALLSEEPARIRQAWRSLSADEAQAVHQHLQRMAGEAGWADVQRQAAAAALRVITALT